MHGRKFERIWTKFGKLQPYSPDGHGLVSELRSCPQARAPRAVYIRRCKWVASSVWEFGTSWRRAQRTERCKRKNRAPQARGVTERRRREGGTLVTIYNKKRNDTDTVHIQHKYNTIRRILLFIDWVKVLGPTGHKVGHFGDIFPANLLA